MIRDVSVETTLNKTWIIKTKVHLETANVVNVNATLRFSLDNHILSEKQISIVSKSNGSFKVEHEIFVNKTINTWWPNGVGLNKQNLYKFKVDLIFENSSESSSKQVKIGFRTIELVQDEVKPKGLTFYFKVNGLPFFAKGSNWIPADIFQELIHEKYVRKLLTAVKDANMNMLRVWGGGIYESDLFYNIADELGILIWQDMMFASALYPTDQTFLDSVSVEIEQNIRRLQHHPSIAIWSGKNTIL